MTILGRSPLLTNGKQAESESADTRCISPIHLLSLQDLCKEATTVSMLHAVKNFHTAPRHQSVQPDKHVPAKLQHKKEFQSCFTSAIQVQAVTQLGGSVIGGGRSASSVSRLPRRLKQLIRTGAPGAGHPYAAGCGGKRLYWRRPCSEAS